MVKHCRLLSTWGMKYIMNHLLTYEIPMTLSSSSPLTSSWDSLIIVLGKKNADQP